MNVKYSGLQARIQERNPLADYIPCFAHSLNLVSHSAVDNISAASKFLELVENVYSFFSASTHRWELLVNVLGGLPVVEHLSDTRWTAHSDASKALNCGYDKIRMVIEQFIETWTKQPKHKRQGVFIQVEYLGKLYLSGVLVCRHGKVSPDKHKAAKHKYGSE